MNARALLATTLLAVLGAAGASSSTVVTVVGLDDPSVDRQNIQDAIDAAPGGATVRLLGTFRLDGERIRLGASALTITGEAIDDDGDGRLQEDWIDGRDNDGDSLIDEDDWETRLIGVDDGSGSPAVDDGVNGLFNRGLVVDGVDGLLRDLTIRDLAFSTFHRAIELIPEWASPSGRCDDREPVAGEVRRLTIERNRFDNSVLGITLLGAVHDSAVRGNVFIDNRVFGAVVEGGAVDCPLSGGSDVDLPLAKPRHNLLVGNVALDANLATAVSRDSLVADNVLEDATIFTLEDTHARVSRNTVSGGFGGLVIEGGSQNLVDRNTISGVFEGIIAGGAADQVLIEHNETSALFVGLDLTFGASGFIAIDNDLGGAFFVDLLLDFGSSDNTVVNPGEAITALDFGTDNRLLGNFVFF